MAQAAMKMEEYLHNEELDQIAKMYESNEVICQSFVYFGFLFELHQDVRS